MNSFIRVAAFQLPSCRRAGQRSSPQRYRNLLSLQRRNNWTHTNRKCLRRQRSRVCSEPVYIQCTGMNTIVKWVSGCFLYLYVQKFLSEENFATWKSKEIMRYFSVHVHKHTLSVEETNLAYRPLDEWILVWMENCWGREERERGREAGEETDVRLSRMSVKREADDRLE